MSMDQFEINGKPMVPPIEQGPVRAHNVGRITLTKAIEVYAATLDPELYQAIGEDAIQSISAKSLSLPLLEAQETRQDRASNNRTLVLKGKGPREADNVLQEGQEVIRVVSYLSRDDYGKQEVIEVPLSARFWKGTTRNLKAYLREVSSNVDLFLTGDMLQAPRTELSRREHMIESLEKKLVVSEDVMAREIETRLVLNRFLSKHIKYPNLAWRLSTRLLTDLAQVRSRNFDHLLDLAAGLNHWTQEERIEKGLALDKALFIDREDNKHLRRWAHILSLDEIYWERVNTLYGNRNALKRYTKRKLEREAGVLVASQSGALVETAISERFALVRIFEERTDLMPKLKEDGLSAEQKRQIRKALKELDKQEKVLRGRRERLNNWMNVRAPRDDGNSWDSVITDEFIARQAAAREAKRLQTEN